MKTLAIFATRLGWMGIVAAADQVQRLTWGHSSKTAVSKELGLEPRSFTLAPNDWPLIARLQAFAEGRPDDFLDIPLDLPPATSFQQQVIHHCRHIPFGQTLTYAQLATAAGSPKAARAVGNVMANNPVPLLVPCHRVIGSGGALGGYSAPGGLDSKQKLLRLEGSLELPTVLAKSRRQRASV